MKKIIILTLFLLPVSINAQILSAIAWQQAVVSGTVVTSHLGGTAASLSTTPDTGNALNLYYDGFVTPAVMSSPSWGSMHVYWGSPDASAPNWGAALYADTQITGTVNTLGTTVTWVSGTQFPTSAQFSGSWKGAIMVINGAPCRITAIGSATSLTCISSQGTHTGVVYALHIPGALVCSAFSSTVATNGWNTITPTGCGTPSANTQYWTSMITASSTQAVGFNGSYGQGCPDNQNNFIGSGGTWYQTLGSFTSNASFPGTANISSTGYDPGDGCPASYIDVTYQTSVQYPLVAYVHGTCDSSTAACAIAMPPVVAGQSIVVFEESTSTVSTPTDSASDTFTQIGSGATVTGGSATYYESAYYIDRPTAGANQVTCNFAALNKDVCHVIVFQGNLASGSLDKNCYDTAVLTTASFTGCATASTTQATELVLSFLFNDNIASASNANFFTTPGPWTLLGSSIGSGISPIQIGVAMQTSSSTGTFAGTGTAYGGSPQISTTTATFK